MAPQNRTSRKIVTRREFLRLSMIAAAGAMVGTQDQPQEIASAHPPSQPEGKGSASALLFQEAPELAELVAQGLLPPVGERLPLNPCVIPVLHQIGKYDSLMNRAHKGVSDRWGPMKMKDHGLVWFDHNLALVPHLCESWEVSADARQWTFHLRQGARWSDGVEFTSADFTWWYENVALNNQLTTGEGYFNGRLLDHVTAAGPYTVTLAFVDPHPLFLYATARGAPFMPGHYLWWFHAGLCPDPAALENEAVAAGYADWADYFNNNRSLWHLNPALPGTGPWVSRNTLEETVFLMERNPYYYGVDADGNQLPYINAVSHRYFSQDNEFTAMVTGGRIDFQARHTSFGYYDLYKDNEAAGGYHVVLGTTANHLAIQLNLTALDPRLRPFFQQRDVRIALSLAVDRAAMNTALFDGLAVPRQYSPLSSSPQYYATLSNAHIAYNPAQANLLLDSLGYTSTDAEGFRLWNDGTGERIHFTIEGTAQAGSSEEAAVQMVRQYYAAVGIDTTYQSVDRDTYGTHFTTNQVEAAWWGGDRTVLPLIAPGIFLGTQTDRPWACAWGLWSNNNADPNGEEPPAGHWINDIWSLWDQISIEPSEAQRDALFRQILDIWATELPMIGFLGENPQPVIMKNNMYNYDEGYPIDDTTADEELLSPETYFWDSSLASTLAANHASGCPGSYFTFTGTNFPASSTALVTINGVPLQTRLPAPPGRWSSFWIRRRRNAGPTKWRCA